MIPNDPVMLLSYVNTQLRDQYASLKDFCLSLDVAETSVQQKLNAIGYEYNAIRNQFI